MMVEQDVSVAELANTLMSEQRVDGSWENFLAACVPDVPAYDFVRQMSPVLMKDLFKSAYDRWYIRAYMDFMVEQGIVGFGGVTPHGQNFDIDEAWVERYCQLPDLTEWVSLVRR